MIYTHKSIFLKVHLTPRAVLAAGHTAVTALLPVTAGTLQFPVAVLETVVPVAADRVVGTYASEQ